LGAAVSVDFTSVGIFNGGNIYTAQLSNASGSFASPTAIGTYAGAGTDNSGTISATIPAGTATGTGYRIRVISSDPASIVADNGSDLTINLGTNSIAPTATQNIFALNNGTTLTVTEGSTPISREWFYGTAAGGPYTTATGNTSTTFIPNFAAAGTYYIVCRSTFACGTITSNQVQVNVTAQGSPQTYIANSTLIVPPGITCIRVEAWGAGGGGTNATSSGRGGGGGGAYTRGNLSVSQGNSVAITVGTGGTAGVAGGSSSVGTIIANGGGSNASSNNGGAGGAASAITGNVVASFAGGTGGNGSTGQADDAGGGGGGSAFTNAPGGTGGNGGSSNTVGGAGGAGTGAGGNGAAADNSPDTPKRKSAGRWRGG
jgi:hypothetical protein